MQQQQKRRFTRAEVAADFMRSFARGFIDSCVEVDEVILLPDFDVPAWLVSYWLTQGSGNYEQRYHSKVVYIQRSRGGVPYLVLASEAVLPQGCKSVAEEDAALAIDVAR